MVSVGATSGGGGGNSCSVDGGRRGLVKGLSRETWKVVEIRYWFGRWSRYVTSLMRRTYIPGTQLFAGQSETNVPGG